MLKDVEGSSLKVKGGTEPASDQGMEKKETREASRVGREGKGPVGPVLTVCQARSQALPHSHIFFIPLMWIILFNSTGGETQA